MVTGLGKRAAFDAGFTLVEMMVAVLLLAIIMPAFLASFIGATFAAGDAHLKEVAVTLSDTALDNVRAVDPVSTLLAQGRPIGTVPSEVDLSDTAEPVSLGTTQALLNNRVYTTTLFAGTCYLQKPSAPSDTVSCTTDKSSAPMVRVVADVTWAAPSGCPDGKCSYVQSTLLSDGGDSALNVNPNDSPDPPTGVTVVAGSKSATVSWAVPSSALPITGFIATASPGGASCSTTGATTCTISGLADGQTYSFGVVAQSTGGTSAPSATVDATPEGY
jgi:prepilin-type N-terminal cleavage/methylation domain-containing protein